MTTTPPHEQTVMALERFAGLSLGGMYRILKELDWEDGSASDLQAAITHAVAAVKCDAVRQWAAEEGVWAVGLEAGWGVDWHYSPADTDKMVFLHLREPYDTPDDALQAAYDAWYAAKEDAP